MKIKDKRRYFRVIWEDGQTTTYPKSPDGFATAEELKSYLGGGCPGCGRSDPGHNAFYCQVAPEGGGSDDTT